MPQSALDAYLEVAFQQLTLTTWSRLNYALEDAIGVRVVVLQSSATSILKQFFCELPLPTRAGRFLLTQAQPTDMLELGSFGAPMETRVQ